MDYDLSRLGSQRFEHLTQALAVATLGPDIQVFGNGPDGGREASFDGTLTSTPGKQWTGYGVLQAKYKQRLESTGRDQDWLIGQLRKELRGWTSRDSKRTRTPQYFIIATNVTLSSVAQTGGIDRIDTLIREFTNSGLKLKGYDVWHADKIRALLENQPNVRRAYADLVLPGDVIARLHEQLQQSEARLEHAWLAHSARSLLADRSVALGESGDVLNTPLPLERVAVDLPASFATPGDETKALAAIIERGDHVLAPALTPRHKPRLVILGGPGQGKSTIGRLLCQIYRAAMLRSEPPTSVADEHRRAAERIAQEFTNAELRLPTLNRIPIHTTLPAYADEIGGGADISLLRHLTSVVNYRASDHLGVSDLKSLLRDWPSVVVLDGLDEVPTPAIRLELASRISDFWAEMTALGADVLLVCTSRPQGFNDALPLDYYDHLTLRHLTPDEALQYADRLLSVRHADNPTQHDVVYDRLSDAADRPATAKLMETPLQITIMTLLLESQNRPPLSRHSLFDSYYNVIYAREAGKPGPLGELLDKYRPYVTELHAAAALDLHRVAGLRGGMDAEAGLIESILPLTYFQSLATKLLTKEGFSEPDVAALAEKVLRAASERLVLIVPRGAGVGFEVRSLQEFMAARALVACPDSDIPDRLESIALSAHWRNTWLLAAGRLFAERPHLRAEITSLVAGLDSQSDVTAFARPSAHLALDLLDDGLAASSPRYAANLVRTAMTLLDGPPTVGFDQFAVTIRLIMESDDALRSEVEREVRKRTEQLGPRSASAIAFVSLTADRSGAVGEWARLERNRLQPGLIESQPEAADEIRMFNDPVEWHVGLTVSERRILESRIGAAVPAREENPRSSASSLLEALPRPIVPGGDVDYVHRMRGVAARLGGEFELKHWRLASVLQLALLTAIGRDSAEPTLSDVLPDDDVAM